jgi:hypothetical protein
VAGPVTGQYATLGIGRQTTLGTPAANANFKMKTVTGDLDMPTDAIELAETDSSRQAGATVITGKRVEGSPEFYCRPDDLGLLAYAVLGANADAGTSPNFTHTATIGSSLPFLTFWKAIASTVLVDQFSDCVISQLVIRGNTAAVLTVAATVMGKTAVFGATDVVLATETQSPIVYPQVQVSKAGIAPADVESFDLTIAAGVTHVWTDRGIMPAYVVPGRCVISGTLTALFQSDADHRLFHTGSPTGTIPVATVNDVALSITATVDANTGFTLSIAKAALRDVPVPPDASGAPIRSTIPFFSEPDPVTPANYLSIVTKNRIAAYTSS